eukprot:gene16881-19741_t
MGRVYGAVFGKEDVVLDDHYWGSAADTVPHAVLVLAGVAQGERAGHPQHIDGAQFRDWAWGWVRFWHGIGE